MLVKFEIGVEFFENRAPFIPLTARPPYIIRKLPIVDGAIYEHTFLALPLPNQ